VLPFVVGAAVATLVLFLRNSGHLGGLSAISVAVACFIFAPGPRQVADRLLLLFALAFGWLPLLGWIPRLGVTVDVPGVVLAAGVGVTCWWQARVVRARRRTVAAPTPAELLALTAGISAAAWWAWPFARLSSSAILQAMTIGWDNNGQFAMFRTNVQLGSFIQVRPVLRSGADRLGYDYPQGMHQAWAQLTRLVTPHPPSDATWLLHTYLVMLVVTIGCIVVAGSMAAARLCRRDLFAAMPAIAIVVALFVFGQLGPFNGWPNYELAIASAAVAITLMVRPTLGPGANFFAVAGMGLAVAYNWFPILIVVVPAVVVAAVRARNSYQGLARWGMTAAIAGTAAAYVLPLFSFSHRGVSFLNATGTLIAPPWGLLIVGVVLLGAVAILRQMALPDLATNLIVGAPAVVGSAAILIVAGFEYASTSHVSYYGQKLAEGVFGVCLLVLSCVWLSDLANSSFRKRLSTPVALVLSLIVSAGLLQLGGYVGPFYGAVKGVPVASGLAVHDELANLPDRSPVAEQLLLSAQIAHSSEASDPSGEWWYVDPKPVSFKDVNIDPGLLAQWFPDLKGDPTNFQYYVSLLVVSPQLIDAHSLNSAAQIIVRELPNPEKSHDHLFVPASLRHAIVLLAPQWGLPGLLNVIPMRG